MGDNLGNSMDLPLEPTTGRLEDEHVHYSPGVVVMASIVDVPEVGIKARAGLPVHDADR